MSYRKYVIAFMLPAAVYAALAFATWIFWIFVPTGTTYLDTFCTLLNFLFRLPLI